MFRSVKDLEAAIREFIDMHNEDPKPCLDQNRGPNPASIARYAQRTTAKDTNREELGGLVNCFEVGFPRLDKLKRCRYEA